MLEDVLKKHSFYPVVKSPKEDFVPIDLSKHNPALTKVNVADVHEFSEYINQYIQKHNARVAIGGYNEERNIYQRSTHFNDTQADERFIHLGVDLWADAGEPVYAPLDGIVHSFQNNKGLGNYGPTIILQHELEGITFYTLYGHLSLESIQDKQEGQHIKAGEAFCTFGDYTVNGDYPPHLHFQVIKDLKSNKGDFPGVTSIAERAHDLANCPDANLVLGKRK